MFSADLVLVGATAVSFPGATGWRLVLMALVLLVGSVWLNLLVTPRDQRPVLIERLGVTDSDGAIRLLQHVLGAQEEERARLARELRELVAQPLVGIGYQLDAASHCAAGSPASAEFAAARESVRQATEEIAVIADELYPGLMGELGLVPALESLRRRIARRSAVSCELTVDGGPFMLPLALSQAFYRFAEEALENVEQHARARSVAVRLTFARPLVTLAISDNGSGFQPEKVTTSAGGVGLRLARELLACEGATMQIDSVPGRGTCAIASATVHAEGPS